jgi:uncharacterized membrane protein YqgA involved in biofilm formation
MQEVLIAIGSFILGFILGDVLKLELRTRLKEAVVWLKNRQK